MRTIVVTIALLCFASGSAAEEKGAKAIFVDTTSGATVPVKTTASASDRTARNTKKAPKPAPKSSTSTPAPAPGPEVSGLMYYVELVSPTGETSRVTTDRTFASGERILLHVVSAIDGDIAIYQRTPNGQAVRLFPDDRIRNGNARIAKGVDTVLPSPTSWFRFDHQSGTEELMLVLTPKGSGDGTTGQPQPSQVAMASYEDVSAVPGGKGLVVETDARGPQPATYVVRPGVVGKPPEPIVVAIRLKHR